MGYVVAAIYPPEEEYKISPPVVLLHDDCYFRNIRFCSTEARARFLEGVMNFYYSDQFDSDLEVEDIIHDDSSVEESEKIVQVLEKVERKFGVLQYTGESAIPHKLGSSKVLVFDQMILTAKNLVVKHGTFLQLKQRKTCRDRFSFVAALRISLTKRKEPKFVFLVHDAQDSSSLKSCTVSDIHSVCGYQELHESESLVLQLAQAIVKEGKTSMILRYDVCTHQASSKGSSNSAYSPPVNLMEDHNRGKGIKKKKTTQKFKKAKVTKSAKAAEEEKEGEYAGIVDSIDDLTMSSGEEFSLISEESVGKRHRNIKKKSCDTSSDNFLVNMLLLHY